MSRITQSLNGWWDYKIAEGEYYKKRVPYSDFAVGVAHLRKYFDKKQDGQAFLIFDGITYSATVTLNGVKLGEMLPYCEYRFDITDIIADKNELSVDIIDITPTFGPSEGWENYSGIIRDVYVEYYSSALITDCWFECNFNGDFTRSTVNVSTSVNGEYDKMTVTLCDPFSNVIYSDAAECCHSFELERPLLWSPEHPHLYTLTAMLYKNGEAVDKVTKKVGFKELKTKGKRFLLNGEPLFLVGVCRHDLFGDSGHIMSEEQMRADMKMIKDSGANFVRLVHYPHHKKIVEIADELGLMISEEPGLWWSDVKNEEIFNGSLEVLRRTVIRDRSHVSVAFWLSFNECMFTPEYLKAAADVCRELDPTRLCSGANCMDIPMTKKHFAECGLDFYTMHPYSPSVERMIESAEQLNDKPLMLTEWGGYHVYENPHLFGEFIDEMVKMWQNDEDKPVIAGAAVWCWAEVFEFNRYMPACKDGVLHEGLVDRFRNPLSCLSVFKEHYAKLNEKPHDERSMNVLKFNAPKADYEPILIENMTELDSQKAAWDKMIADSLVPIKRFVFVERKQRVLKFGPVLPDDVYNIGNLPTALSKKPIVITDDESVKINLPETDKIYLVGGVGMPKGFPIEGVFGETAAVCKVEFDDGTTDEIKLRNGYEISTACAWFGPSRINPTASNAPRVIDFVNQPDRERYVANMITLDLPKEKSAKSITLCGANNGYNILLYGVTVAKK